MTIQRFTEVKKKDKEEPKDSRFTGKAPICPECGSHRYNVDGETGQKICAQCSTRFSD